MAPPIYFFAGLRLDQLISGSAFSRVTLEKYGLAEVFSDIQSIEPHCRTDLTTAGPGGASGAMFATSTNGQPPHRFGHYPDFQQWTKVRNEPELWLGIDREQPPTPADLARAVVLQGHPVKLADGNTYEVPVIRSPVRPTGLPQDMVYDAAGEFTTAIKPQYADLWEQTQPAWDFLYGSDDDDDNEPREMGFDDILDHCLRFLGVNYRYGRYEQMVLRLVDTSRGTWEKMFSAALDMPFVESVLASQKKTSSPPAPDTPSSEPGPVVDETSTGPAEPNSTSSPENTPESEA